MNKRANMLTGDAGKMFTWQTLILCIVGLAINLLLANLVKGLGLPLYIDNVGSILVGALAGAIPGMAVGFLSNFVNSYADPITMYYGILTVIMAMLAAVYSQKGMFKRVRGVVAAIGSYILIGGAVGSVMTWLLYGGGIGGIGAPLATIMNEGGLPAFWSQLFADIVIDVPDKTITVLLVCMLLKFYPGFLYGEFPLSYLYDRSTEESSKRIEEIQKYYKKTSIKSMILYLIIVCAAAISVASTFISYKMYTSEVLVPDINNALIYLIRLISVSFAITLIISALTIWFATKRIAEPIEEIVVQSQELKKLPPETWMDSDVWKNRREIKSGDEIEELYRTVCEEQETVSENAKQMKKTEEELRHSEELKDALEAARHASLAKGQFLSRMSHEIRTPLNAVIGYMDMAKVAGDEPEKMMHYVENSGIAARHLLSIINDVLDISSIESGKMKIAHEEFNLSQQIETISTIFTSQSREKGVNFSVEIKDVIDEWVCGDSLRVKQVLMNLLSNAVKFTPENGHVVLSIDQINQTESQIFMKFQISDDGIGMSEEYQKKLFTPFEQESATTAQKYGGTGLGLSITQNLVTMMKGAISVKSTQGEGTTFVVTIPFEKSTEKHEKAVTFKDFSHIRALVVDDDQSSCEYIRSLLKRCGVKSDTVTSGEAAIRQIQRRKDTDYVYNLCILDWNMPGLNGIQTAEKIRMECDEELPVIIATAYDTTEIEEEAKELNVKRVISKPLFQSSLFDLLVSLYGKYEIAPDDGKEMEDLKGLHLLLAEDNPMNLEIAVAVLEKSGIIVDTAENGKEAVDKFVNSRENTYAAILMDVQMPVMDGYTATGKIRSSTHPQAASIPIIAMTANAFNEDIASALASGMNDHISKPVDYEKLITALKKSTQRQ